MSDKTLANGVRRHSKSYQHLGMSLEAPNEAQNRNFRKVFSVSGPLGCGSTPRAIGSWRRTSIRNLPLGASQRRRSYGGRPEGHRESGAGLLSEFSVVEKPHRAHAGSNGGARNRIGLRDRERWRSCCSPLCWASESHQEKGIVQRRLYKAFNSPGLPASPAGARKARHL